MSGFSVRAVLLSFAILFFLSPIHAVAIPDDVDFFDDIGDNNGPDDPLEENDPNDNRDRDGDGILDKDDNCPDVYNPRQEDENGDGIGSACQTANGLPDEDEDGIHDLIDNCPMHPNGEQRDFDGDGIGDACDKDRDGDGIPNHADNCKFKPNPDQNDYNHDGTGDACNAEKCGNGRRDPGEECDIALATQAAAGDIFGPLHCSQKCKRTDLNDDDRRRRRLAAKRRADRRRRMAARNGGNGGQLRQGGIQVGGGNNFNIFGNIVPFGSGSGSSTPPPPQSDSGSGGSVTIDLNDGSGDGASLEYTCLADSGTGTRSASTVRGSTYYDTQHSHGVVVSNPVTGEISIGLEYLTRYVPRINRKGMNKRAKKRELKRQQRREKLEQYFLPAELNVFTQAQGDGEMFPISFLNRMKSHKYRPVEGRNPERVFSQINIPNDDDGGERGLSASGFLRSSNFLKYHVYYPRQLENAYGSPQNLLTRAARGICFMNTAFENSRIPTQATIVGMTRASQGEFKFHAVRDLNRFIKSKSEANKKRRELGASITLALTPASGIFGLCGLAPITLKDKIRANSAVAYSKDGCGDVVIAHESGHIFGMGHGVDDPTAGDVGWEDHSHAFDGVHSFTKQDYSTLMHWHVMTSRVIPYWANPAVRTEDGQPTGDLHKADAAHTFHDTHPIIEGFAN